MPEMSKAIDLLAKKKKKEHEIFWADYESNPEVYLFSQLNLDIVLCNKWQKWLFNQTFSHGWGSFLVGGVGWLIHKVYFDDEDEFLPDFVIG